MAKDDSDYQLALCKTAYRAHSTCTQYLKVQLLVKYNARTVDSLGLAICAFAHAPTLLRNRANGETENGVHVDDAPETRSTVASRRLDCTMHAGYSGLEMSDGARGYVDVADQ